MAMPGSGSYRGIGIQPLKYRGKSYGLMLLLAFGAALIGVMAVHKLREKRIYNILLKEKDKELFVLQVLLQKERDQAQEIRRKSAEMKEMIYSLRSQETELDGRILEMQSTISSLKDDHQAMAVALEDKTNEIKMLRDKETDISKDSQEASLREVLRLKEAEIEDLTRRLALSMQGRKAHQENITISDKKEGSETADWQPGSSDKQSEQGQGGQEKSNDNSLDKQRSVIREEANAEGLNHGNVDAVTAKDGVGEINEGIERGNSEGGMKFEVVEGSDKVLAQPAKHGGEQPSRKRVKRLRALVRNRRMGNKGKMNRKFGTTGFNNGNELSKIPKTDIKIEISLEKRADENHPDTQMGGEAASSAGEVNSAEGEKGRNDAEKQPEYSADAKLIKSEDQGDNAATTGTAVKDGDSQVGDEGARMENTNLSLTDDAMAEKSPNGESNSAHIETQKPEENDETGRSMHANVVQENQHDDTSAESGYDKEKVDENKDNLRETEAEDAKQSEEDNREAFQGASKEKEELRERTDDPEF